MAVESAGVAIFAKVAIFGIEVYATGIFGHLVHMVTYLVLFGGVKRLDDQSGAEIAFFCLTGVTIKTVSFKTSILIFKFVQIPLCLAELVFFLHGQHLSDCESQSYVYVH